MAVVLKQQEDILQSHADVLVCPTNAVGVMGAGLAEEFRYAFPGFFDAYKKWCSKHSVSEMVPYAHSLGAKKSPLYVYCLHTKRHWRETSVLSNIQKGLDQLLVFCDEHDISSVAIPALGCGKGQLTWEEVLPLIEEFAEKFGGITHVYTP